MWKMKPTFRFLLHRARNSKKSRIRRRKIVSVQHIEELPDEIIHMIFDHLGCAKDVVRTAVLSKNWNRIFNSYQSFDFDQRWFRMPWRGKGHRRAQKTNFIEYIDRTVATRLLRVPSVKTFRFYADVVDRSVVDCCMRSFDAAKTKKVQKLDIQLYGVQGHPSQLELCPSVEFLKLTIHSLGSIVNVDECVKLEVISLRDAMFLDEKLMKKLEGFCPLLEDLRLVRCPKLQRLEISSLDSLKRIQVQDCRNMKCIQITASSLESFCYHAKAYKKCKIDLKGSENLKILMLKDMVMSESALKRCISLCSLLKKLVLQNCNRIEKLSICSLTLKSLTLIECVRLKEVDIDAPNLYTFEYNGHVMPFPFAHASSRLSEVKLAFKPNPVCGSELKFESFFGNFDGSNGFKLIVYTKQNMEIFEEPREADLSKLNLCQIELSVLSWKLVKIVDDWLCQGHGKSLTLVSSNHELIKLVSTLVIDREIIQVAANTTQTNAGDIALKMLKFKHRRLWVRHLLI